MRHADVTGECPLSRVERTSGAQYSKSADALYQSDYPTLISPKRLRNSNFVIETGAGRGQRPTFMWFPISTAPFDRDLELGIVDLSGVRAFLFRAVALLAAGSRRKPRCLLPCVRRIGAIGLPTGARPTRLSNPRRRVISSYELPLRPFKREGDCIFGFHSRASLCASAVCAGVMRRAIRSRKAAAPSLPCAADKLNHMYARTLSWGTPRPLS